MHINTFRELHRQFIEAWLEHPDGRDWPYVAATTHSERLDQAIRGRFLAVDLIDGQPWYAEGLLRADQVGPPIVNRLTVKHYTEPHREVTGAVLRALPVARIRDRALAGLPPLAASRRLARDAGIDRVSEADAVEAGRAATEAAKPRPGRRAKPDAHYERIARRYLELLAAGRRDVLLALAAEESERAGRVIPRETVRDWVRKATRLDYLAPGTPGRAEPRPGARLNPQPKEKHG